MTGILVVGAGTWGEQHCRVLSSMGPLECVSLEGVCDLDEDKAMSLAERYGAKSALTDYREGLDRESVDAVIVATPDSLHTQIVIDAAVAGKHILVEKPMATSTADCRRMADAVQEAGVQLMVDYHGRWNPTLQFGKQKIDSGELGALRYMTITLGNRRSYPLSYLKWADEHGVLWFLGCHAVDLARWYVGSSPTRVSAVMRDGVLKSKGSKAADFFLVVMEFPAGEVVTLEHSWIMPEGDPSVKEYHVKAVGERSTVRLDLSHHRAVEYVDHTGTSTPEMFAAPSVFGAANGFVKAGILHFIDCVRNNTEPFVNVHDGVEATRVVEAIIESAHKGTPVEL